MSDEKGPDRVLPADNLTCWTKDGCVKIRKTTEWPANRDTVSLPTLVSRTHFEKWATLKNSMRNSSRSRNNVSRLELRRLWRSNVKASGSSGITTNTMKRLLWPLRLSLPWVWSLTTRSASTDLIHPNGSLRTSVPYLLGAR